MKTKKPRKRGGSRASHSAANATRGHAGAASTPSTRLRAGRKNATPSPSNDPLWGRVFSEDALRRMNLCDLLCWLGSEPIATTLSNAGIRLPSPILLLSGDPTVSSETNHLTHEQQEPPCNPTCEKDLSDLSVDHGAPPDPSFLTRDPVAHPVYRVNPARQCAAPDYPPDALLGLSSAWSASGEPWPNEDHLRTQIDFTNLSRVLTSLMTTPSSQTPRFSEWDTESFWVIGGLANQGSVPAILDRLRSLGDTTQVPANAAPASLALCLWQCAPARAIILYNETCQHYPGYAHGRNSDVPDRPPRRAWLLYTCPTPCHYDARSTWGAKRDARKH